MKRETAILSNIFQKFPDEWWALVTRLELQKGAKDKIATSWAPEGPLDFKCIFIKEAGGQQF